MVKNDDDVIISAPSSKQSPGIFFPVGGLFFYWQVGVIVSPLKVYYEYSYIMQFRTNPWFAYHKPISKKKDTSNTLLSGASNSAGALSATLAKTEVNPYDATELALSMADEAGIWDRPLGLQGVWGSIIYDWLDRLLPLDAEERVKEEVRVYTISHALTFVSRFTFLYWYNYYYAICYLISAAYSCRTCPLIWKK